MAVRLSFAPASVVQLHQINVSNSKSYTVLADQEMGLGYVHSNFPIIARRREHSWILGIPRHGIDATTGMALESIDERAVSFVPDVDFRV